MLQAAAVVYDASVYPVHSLEAAHPPALELRVASNEQNVASVLLVIF